MGVLFGSFVILLAFWVMARLSAPALAERRRTYDAFLRRHGGRFLSEGSSWFSAPEVQLSHRGLEVVVTEWTSDGDAPVLYTEARLIVRRVNQRGLRFEVSPERFLSGLARLLGMQDVEVGEARFDTAFVLRTNDEAALRALLVPDARMTLLQLLPLFNREDLGVSLDRDTLVVRKPGRLQAAQLEQFYDLATRFFDHVVAHLEGRAAAVPAASPPGLAPGEVVLLPPGPGTNEGEVRCQVCGEVIAGPCVRCQLCGTPHHRECWDYNGRCSTYGCRSGASS